MKIHGWFLLAVVAASPVVKADEPLYQGRPIDAWILDLKSEDESTQGKARTVLSRVGPEAAASLPKVVALLDDRATGIREGAADALGRMGPAAKAAIPPLIKALKAEEPTVVLNAAIALGRIGPESRVATATLIAALKPKDPARSDSQLIDAILFAIAKIEPEPVPILVEKCMKHEDGVVREKCLEFLCLLREEAAPAIPALLEILQGNEDSDKFYAGEVLGSIGPGAKVAVPALARAGNLRALLRIDPEGELTARAIRDQLGSKDEDIRLGAALTLAQFDPTSRVALPIVAGWVRAQGDRNSARFDPMNVVPVLAAMDLDGRVAIPALLAARGSKDGNGRSETIIALGSFGPRGKEAVPALVKWLSDKKEYIRRDAAWALGSIGPGAKAAIPDLVLATKDEDSTVRKMAYNALAQIDRDGETSVPALRAAMKDKDPWVVHDATFAIGTLGAKARPAVPELRALMKEHQSVGAAYSLCRIGEDVPAALAALIAPLDREKFSESLLLCPVALARLGPAAHEATPALITLLERSRSPEELLLDELAVLALGRIGPGAKAAVPILKARMQTEEGPLRDWCAIVLSRIDPDAENGYPTPYASLDPGSRRRRQTAQLAVVEANLIPMMGGIHEVQEGAHEGLILLFGNLGPRPDKFYTFPLWIGCRVDDPLVLAVTCWAYARANPGMGASVPLLIEALKHDDAFVRTTAAYSLGLLGPSAKSAIPALRNAQADQERSVRDWATRALKRISP